MYTAVQVQSLAAEADAAICRAKEITKSKTVEDSAGIRTLEYALMLNRSYRRALFSVLERKLQRREEQEMNEEYRLNLKQQFSEGILLACVSCIWLYGKLDRWNRGLQVVSQNAQKLAVLLVPSVQSPLTERKGHEDVLKQLQSVLSSNSRAWKMFAYSWKAAIWIQERDAPSSLPEVPENFSRDIPGSRLSKELGPNHSSTELEVKQMIFKSFVLDHHLRHSRRQLCTEDYYDIHRKRDAWLREASGIVKNSQYAQSDLANKLKNLRHLFELVDRFQDPMHRRSLDGNYLVVNNDFLKEMSETLIKDAAISNMVGCLLSHLNDTRAMEFFHKALCIDPSRQETIENIVKYLLHLGEIKGADELLIISLSSKASEGSATKTADYHLPTNCRASSDESRQMRNLCLTFLVASLLNNTERMLQSANDLVSSKPCSGFELVELFALLQSNRPGLALESLLNNINGTEQFSRPIFDIGSALYEADCYVGLETDGIVFVPSLLEKALGEYKRTAGTGLRQQSQHDHLLQAIIYNNRGIAYVMEGNMDLAGGYFKEACKALEQARLLQAYNCSSLQPYFNLTLLHFCKGSIHNAMETWMYGRGMSPFVNALSTKELKSMFQQALEGYQAQVRGSDDTAESCEALSLHTLHIHPWNPQIPERTHIFLMDCIILLCAVEKRQLYVFSQWANNEA